MNYPTNLLPNPAYKKIDCDLSEYHLVRYTDTIDKSEIVEPSTGLIKAKYISYPSENISDLSINLLGIFQHEHLEIELTEKGKEFYMVYCEPDIKVEPPLYEEDFELNNNRGCWHLIIGEIQDTPVEYKIEQENFNAICKVIHTPMNWNYWHFSIRWLLEDNEYWIRQDKRGKKTWKKRLAHDARSHLQRFASIEIPKFKTIERGNYIK